MKLDRLTITNFLRIADLDLDLSTSKIHFFCGPNESGKSTVRDAVRFVLLGDSDRVELKKNYKQLVHKGGKKGIVGVQFEGRTVTRDVATGVSEMDKLPEMAQQTAMLCFGAQTFTDLTLDERRKFLFALTQVQTDVEVVAQMMKDGAGERQPVPEALITRLRSLFRVSVEAAHKSCKEELTRLRAKWSDITGEVYGSIKGAVWEPTAPPDSEEDLDLESIESQIVMLRAGIGENNTAIGRMQSEIKQRETLGNSLKRLEGYRHNLVTLKGNLASLQRDADGGEHDGKTYVGYTETIKINEELIERAEAAKRVLTCPACSQALRLTEDDLEFADPDDLNMQRSDEDLDAIRAQTVKLRGELAAARAEIDTLVKKISAGEGAGKLTQDINSRLAVLATEEQLKDMQASVDRQDVEMQALIEQEGRARAYQRVVEQTAQKKIDALVIHQSIMEWTLAETALSPSGIPGELLGKALGSINERMKASAKRAGWQAPQITEDMEVVRADGHIFGLLSKSAQWRVSAIVAEAISDLSGFRLLSLDEMDVLDLPGRAQFAQWILSLGDSYDTILIMATVKERPKLPAEIAVHWLEQGAEVAA